MPPDLTVDTPVISGFNGLPGDSVRFDGYRYATKARKGPGPPLCACNRSTTPPSPSSDRQLITWEVAPLNAGSSRTYNILNENVHNWVATLYYGACVDSVTDESDTTKQLLLRPSCHHPVSRYGVDGQPWPKRVHWQVDMIWTAPATAQPGGGVPVGGRETPGPGRQLKKTTSG